LNQHRSQVRVATFADAPERTLPPLDRCLGVKPTKPQLAPVLELPWISRRSHERCGQQDNSGNRRQQLAVFSLRKYSPQLRGELGQPALERRNLLQIHCAQSAQERRKVAFGLPTKLATLAAQFPMLVANTNPFLREHAPDLVRSAVRSWMSALHPMQGLHGLLLALLIATTVYISTSERGTDCSRVVGVVLASEHEGLHVLCSESSGPDVQACSVRVPNSGAVAGFNANQAWLQLSRRKRRTPRDAVFVEAAAALAVDAMHLDTFSRYQDRTSRLS